MKLSTNHINNASVRCSVGWKVSITFQPNSKAVCLVKDNSTYDIFVEPNGHKFLSVVLNDCKIIPLTCSNTNRGTSEKVKSFCIFDVHCHFIGSFRYIALYPISEIFFRTPDYIRRQQRFAGERSIICDTRSVRERYFQTTTTGTAILKIKIPTNNDSDNDQSNKTLSASWFRFFFF